MNDDPVELLHQFAVSGSDEAFRRLVERYTPLVYHAALRVVAGDAHLAEDVSQMVFCELARQAGSFRGRVFLPAWLHQLACSRAVDAVRRESRRRVREERATEMERLERTESSPWVEIAPQLDSALQRLKRGDREALLARFFDGASFRQVGALLGTSEDAAQKRVTRALQRLRALLSHQGVTCSAAALPLLLAGNAVPVAPQGLTAALTASAVAQSAPHMTLTTSASLLMSKIKVALAGAVLAGATTALVLQHHALERSRADNAELRQRLAAASAAPAGNNGQALRDEVQRLQAEHSELLELRGEVARLRAVKAGLQKQLALKAANPAAAQPVSEDIGADSTAEEPFRTQVRTDLAFGEVLLTGGWETAPGRRMLLFTAPELGDTGDGQNVVTVRAITMEVADGALAAHGLGSLAAEVKQTEQHGAIFARDDYEALLEQLRDASDDAQLLSMPVVQTLPGRSAVMEIVSADGQRFRIGATPNLSQDGSGFELEIDATVAAED